MATHYGYYQSPIGWLEIITDDTALLEIHFLENEPTRSASGSCFILDEAIRQINEYFQGKRQEFSVSYHLAGTDFQRQVWQALTTIPYGKTASYADIAQKIGNPQAVRAVGNANNKNRLPIIIPCHRIVGSNRTLTGYAGGLWRKQWLIEHEFRL